MPEVSHRLSLANLPPDQRREIYLKDIARYVGHFSEYPYRKLGDSDSGHGVLFGELSDFGDVSLKPFVTNGQAEHENTVLTHAIDKGFDALEPLTIATEGLAAAYLVTRYRPNLRHLGQLNWRQSIASRELRTTITPTLNFVGVFSAKLHAKGITHGDLQAKNFTLTTDGQPVLADVENGQIRLRGEELTRKADRDLFSFAYSVLRRGLLEDRSIHYRLGYLRDELIDPNLDAMPPHQTYDRRQAILDNVAKAVLAKLKTKHPAGKAA